MKRLFQRPGSTASIRAKQSAPSSPDELRSSPDAHQKQRTRRSYSPERLMQSLSFGGSKTSKEKAESPPSVAEAAPFAAISTVKPQPASPRSTPDDLGEQVAAYAAASTEESQYDAIKAIYEMICVEDDTMRIQMSEVDARALVGVCSQRLRVDFQRRLGRINSYKLEGQLKSETDNAESELSFATVAVVDRVLKDTSSTHVAGLVKERLPSTVVKVLQASDNGALKLDSRIVDHCLSLLMTLVQFSDTARELFETSTLHRLFFFKFASLKHQYVGLQIVETLSKLIQRDMRRKLISHVEEYQCLFGLLEAIVDGKSFEKVVIITRSVLRSAYDDGIVSLHKQLRTAHYYEKLMVAFRSLLDRDLISVEGAKDQVSRIKQRHTSIRSAISELCLSGCEEAIALRIVSTEKCFQLAGPKPKASMFNCEAFLMLCQMLKHLRLMINREPTIDDGGESREWLEELECQYIQKVGRIVAQNRVDYLFLRRTAILEDLIKHIDVYPELTKLAVGSVLEAAAIEASVVLYPELTALATTLIQPSCSSSSLTVLLSFVINLIRFHTLYRNILHEVGVMQAVLNLFQSQALTQCTNQLASTKINVAYPTSTLKIGHMSRQPGDSTPVNERSLLLLLTSHCRQTCVARRQEVSEGADRRVFSLVMEILIAFTSSPHEVMAEEDMSLRPYCDVTLLECLCVLLADEAYQDQAFRLWTSILRIALHFKKQNTSLYNTMNCMVQSLRYVTLSLYYHEDTDVTFAFQGSYRVLRHGLSCLEELLRPSQKESIRKARGSIFDGSEREQVMVALSDCGGLFICLTILCTLVRTTEKDAALDGDETGVLAMKLIHILINSSSNDAGTFDRSLQCGFYASLVNGYLQMYETESQSAKNTTLTCLQLLVALAIDNYEFRFELQPTATAVDSTTSTLRHPEALAVFIQLFSLWSHCVASQHQAFMFDALLRILSTPDNANLVASVSLGEVILRCFAATLPVSHENVGLRMSLLDEGHHSHESVTQLLKLVTQSSVDHAQICRWFKLILRCCNQGAISENVNRGVSLLKILVDLAILSNEDARSVPMMKFEASTDGFCYVQIPEVPVRATSTASGQSASTSLASLSQAMKSWPPADGYTVMVWFRIDGLEAKGEREKLYWDLLMSNKCVMCKSVMKDDHAMKCSHRYCRGCQEALLSCGGECVVCNPPMFYLYRLRSGDGKSVSELFVKGTKLYMRTSSSKTVYQFTHTPLERGKWQHAAIVHTRQRFQSSHASLYLNGIQQEMTKVSYPSSVSSGQPLSGLIGIPSQARRASSSKWTVGPMYLVDDALSGHIINCVYAAGPAYGGLFFGFSGSGDIALTLDHLQAENLAMLDDYTKDPIRTLIESVDAEKVNKSSFLRGSLSLASAASTAAAAIVQDMKANSNQSVFSRIPSTVPRVNIPIPQERILLAYAPRNGVDSEQSILPNTKLDGRPWAQLVGETRIVPPFSTADVLYEVTGSASRFVYLLLEQAASASEVDYALNILVEVLHGHQKNLEAMEHEHGYGIINFLLHQKAVFLTKTSLALLYRIVGVDLEVDDYQGSRRTGERQSAIRNVSATQYFILDYSLWQNVSSDIQQLLFSTLYGCLMTGDEILRERNRGQLQSQSVVRQLLYVFLDQEVDESLLRIIAGLILICLTGNGREQAFEANFSDVASFLASTLSPRFARSRVEESNHATRKEQYDFVSNTRRTRANTTAASDDLPEHATNGSFAQRSIGRLCLSPRGTGLTPWGRDLDYSKSLRLFSDNRDEDGPGQLGKAQQSRIQDLLLDTLIKAVQKHDLKENKERDEREGDGAESGSATAGVNSAGQSRMQLPSSTKLTGYRKILSPRWIGYFLFPTPDSSTSIAVAPSTIILALRLLGVLLSRPRYETVFKRDGYYRLLAQGLPCDHRVFSSRSESSVFPFDQMWYTLLCMMLGTPVNGIPHEIQFDMFNLTKDFELNIQGDRLVNANIIWTILATIRRHYNDPLGFISLRDKHLGTERPILPQVAHVLYQPADQMFHLEVLDFLAYLFENMASIRKLLLSGSDKFRSELMEELCLLACAASRAEVLTKYAPKEKRVHQVLLSSKKQLSAYEFATCAVSVADGAAAEDENGEDPFQHPVAVRALRLIVSILMDFLIYHPRGIEYIDNFLGSRMGSALMPPLHDGLQMRFTSLVLMGLLDQIRSKLSDESALSEHKSFGSNLKEFFTLAVLKMQVWQHPQHGDGCPKVFECCDKVHFAGGPIILLDLALFVLGETPTGSTTTSATATLSNMISDSLNKGKKRRQIRQMLGRMSLSKSAELASLTSCMYTVLNAVVTHLLQGHRSEVADEDLVEVLQLLHLNREVFMSPRNNQDKNVFVCLCRYLLQFLTDPNAALRHVAARLWIDLMKCQRALMVEILTVELRRSGAPYSINLMKNGFDVLLDCPDDSASDQGSFLESASLQKFHHWLEVVGPPLKELETKLDRVFLKSMVESKEVVRDAWLGFHRRTTQHKAKESKRFASRLEWFTSMEREYVECLLEMQQREFSRQRKWRQDRIDRQKFIAREWYQLRQNLLEQALGPEPSEDNHSAAIHQKSILLPQIIQQSRMAKAGVKQQAQLDMTEGPRRMRKRFVTSTSTRRTFENLGMDSSLQRPPSALPEVRRGILRRRFSDSDLLRIKAPIKVAEDSRALQKDRVDMSKMDGTNLIPRPPGSLTRRGSFETLFPRADQDTSEYSMETSYALGSRRKDSQSTNHDSGDEGERDADETSGTGAFNTGFNSDDDEVDEKLRPLLVPGDEIMDIYDCLRVDGMDSCPGVFIMCNDNVYIIDNYQVAPPHGRHSSGGGGSDARVVEVSREAPTRLERRLSLRFQHVDSEFSSLDHEQHLTTPGGRLLSLQRSSFTHQCRFWSYDDILEIHKRRHQLRHVAIELFAHDGRNYLITFESQTQRENVFHSLLAKCPNVRGAANGMDRTAVSGDLYSQLRKLLRQNMTERWIAREITNFEYLMHLNTLAGRSYNDLTQYPVFPWILSDYSSPSLDLDDPAVYRDLAKPMGALFREEEFRTRYESLAEGVDEDDPMSSKPFHYGTHYSSAGIVLHYLMRMEPFTTQFLRLQGGKFDHADRLFSSVAGAWKSAAGFESAQNGTQDVKELIPEFFYLPAFLKNVNHHEFGKDQNGVAVNDVELPPWANGSAREFVRIHREALESEFVSVNLHHWIDLIFGYKQQGAPAVEACNVFYHLTYEGAVDLDSISDANMKQAIVDQISEFGQTPSQLFKTPHPSRVRGSAPSSGSITHTQPNSGTASLPPATATGSESAPSSSSFMGNIPSSPAPTSFGSLGGSRGLASSFIEGSDIMSRVHNMLTSSSLGSGVEDSVAILDQAAFLQQEPRRELALNPVVSAHRGFSYSSVGTLASRGRHLSSGALAASIRQIEMNVASVTREEKIIATSDKCLLVPPRFHEFLAWGFQDRSLKVLSSGSFEGGHSGDSKVVISFEIDFPISVGCITSDGRTFIAGGAGAPVIRIWQFSSKKASSATLLQRKRTYGAGLHSSNPSVRSLIPMTTLSTPSHRGSITAVQACRAFSVIVSGCSSGVAGLWDLNRFRFVRTLPTLLTEDSGPNDSIGAIAINESTGDITVALGAVFGVYDINGDLMTRLSYETLLYDPQFSRARITSIAVNRSEASEWAKEKTVITGHADGVLCIWAYSHTGFGEDEWGVDLRGRHLITKSLGHGTSTSRSAITAVYLSTDEHKLFTGNADGLLSVWTPSMQPSTPNTPTSTPSVPSPLQS